MDEIWIITEKGRALMGLMSHSMYVPPIALHYGQALYALEAEYEVMPWIMDGLAREGYIYRDWMTEQVGEILVEDSIRHRRI